MSGAQLKISLLVGAFIAALCFVVFRTHTTDAANVANQQQVKEGFPDSVTVNQHPLPPLVTIDTPVERGVYNRIRFDRVEIVETTAESRQAPSLELTQAARDGRSELLPDETAKYTLHGKRMDVRKDVLAAVRDGETANLQLPTPHGEELSVQIEQLRRRAVNSHMKLCG